MIDKLVLCTLHMVGWQTEDSLQNLPWKASGVVPDVVAKKSASLPENAMHRVQQNSGQVLLSYLSDILM